LRPKLGTNRPKKDLRRIRAEKEELEELEK
jgi:hypothetical protein